MNIVIRYSCFIVFLLSAHHAGANQSNLNISVSGLLEIENQNSNPNNETDNEIDFATAELGILTIFNSKISSQLTFLYEENSTDLGVDIANISISLSEQLSVTAGKGYIPFGSFQSNMISDPFTLELGEMNETGLQLMQSGEHYNITAFTFSGDRPADKPVNTGINLSFSSSRSKLGLTYVTNFASSDAFEYSENDFDTRVAGLNMFFESQFNNIIFYSEMVSALDSISIQQTNSQNTEQADLQSISTELGYLLTEHNIIIISIQETKDCEHLSYPENTLGITYSSTAYKHLGIAVELMRQEFYDRSKMNVLTFQLTHEF